MTARITTSDAVMSEAANGQLDKANWRLVMDEARRSAGLVPLTTKEFDEAWDDFQRRKALGEFPAPPSINSRQQWRRKIAE